MKLSQEQLKAIDKVLTDLGVTFLDYKVEITDHIACEVEEMCMNENVYFNDAFEVVLRKWSAQLKKTDSFWLGWQHVFPKIIMADISKRARNEKFISIIPVILFFICFAFFDIGAQWFDVYTTLIKTVYFILFGILSLLYVKLNFRSVKTSHRFLFNQPFYVFAIFAVAFLILDAGFLMTMYLLVMVFQMPFMLRNAFRHARFVKAVNHINF